MLGRAVVTQEVFVLCLCKPGNAAVIEGWYGNLSLLGKQHLQTQPPSPKSTANKRKRADK
jgi:hypothetical protein